MAQPPQYTDPTQQPDQGNLPPPPPGPPPSNTAHHDPSFPPPPQDQAGMHQNPLYSHPIDQQQYQQTSPQELPPPPSQQPPQSFPPPPSQPPPQQQTDNLHQQTHDLNQQTQDIHHQTHGINKDAQNYTIPTYNPAAPTFAPPPTDQQQQPTNLDTTTAAAAAGGSSNLHAQQQHQPGHSPITPVEEEGHHKSKWSGRFANLGLKAAAPINNLAHKFGSQSFLPETMDKECEKAATILKSFCKKGVYADPGQGHPTSTDPAAKESVGDGIIDPTKEKPRERVIVTIPPKVISRALGLAIFTTLRAGYAVTGATGSGILIARLPDGSWGPPSGIQVHSVGGGFSIGLDIYDCVCVINTKEALDAFTNSKVNLGSDLAISAGPYGAGGAVGLGSMGGKESPTGEKPVDVPPPATDTNTLKPETTDKKSHRRSLSASSFKPVFSYVKSRGFYAGIKVDGTVVVERKDANAAFYGSRLTVDQILKGQVPPSQLNNPTGMWPAGAKTLHDVLRGAEAGILQAGGDTPATGIPMTGAPAAGAPVGVPVTGATTAAPPLSGTTAPLGAHDSFAPPQQQGTTGAGEQLPAYVDDGVARPGVGDYKYT